MENSSVGVEQHVWTAINAVAVLREGCVGKSTCTGAHLYTHTCLHTAAHDDDDNNNKQSTYYKHRLLWCVPHGRGSVLLRRLLEGHSARDEMETAVRRQTLRRQWKAEAGPLAAAEAVVVVVED